jgi:hypothetical protein
LRNFAEIYIARLIVAINVVLWLVLPVHNLIFYTIEEGICSSSYSLATQYYHSMLVLITLISQIIVFVITMIPWTSYFFYIAATISIINKSNERLAIERFYSFIIEPILYLFPICSFYLYIMTSEMFPMELMSMLRTVLRYRWFNKPNRIEPIKNDVIGTTATQNPVKSVARSRSFSYHEKY